MKNVAPVLLFNVLALLAAACSGSNDTTTIAPAAPAPTEDPNATTDPDPATTDPPPAPGEQPKAFALAAGLTINEIALNQGVKVSIVKDGTVLSKTNAPIVAGRSGVLRVYVTPAASWDGRSVTAELRISSQGKAPVLLTDKKSLQAKSTDDVTTSTFNFDLPAATLTKDASFSVALIDATATAAAPDGSSAALFPKDGTTQPMGLVATGVVKVVVVPVQYDTDGSGRLPDTSSSQLAIYKNTMLSRYPASDVQVSVHEPYSWTSTISGNGTGFNTILNAIVKLRQTDRVADDTYYYAALAPSTSFSSFCQGGCVTGLSPLAADPRDTVSRASVGIGYPGDTAAGTMAHEVGHAHGRNHAPCGGAQGVDPSFPYSTGGVGVQGYDITTKTFISTTKGKDMMGYCDPKWVSDYTFSALYDRIAYVTGAKDMITTSAPADYQIVAVDGTGAVSSVETVTLGREPMGEPRPFTYLTKAGTTAGSGTAKFYKYDHLDGGMYVIPAGAASASAVRVDGLTKTLQLKK